MDGWKLIALFVVQIGDIEVWLRSKINYNYSWFLRSGSSRLIKWIYKERYELLLLKRKQQHNYSLSKQTQPRFLLLACLPPCNVAYAFIQLARKRVQRFEKMAGIVNKVYCACSLILNWREMASIVYNVSRLFLALLWKCIPWQPYFLFIFFTTRREWVCSSNCEHWVFIAVRITY